jgi:hypothetical protein
MLWMKKVRMIESRDYVDEQMLPNHFSNVLICPAMAAAPSQLDKCLI